MFCPNCGYQVNDSANFCQKCGTQIQPIHNVHMASQNRNADGVLNCEAIKIYLNNILTLECIRNKLKANLEEISQKIKYNKGWNYLGEYKLFELAGDLHNIYFFFDGKSYYIATDTEYGKQIVFYGDSSWVKHGHQKFVCINDNSIKSMIRWGTHTTFFEKQRYTQTLLEAYEDFKQNAPLMYQENLIKIDGMSQTLAGISGELDKANNLLQRAYQVNIIPLQFRNLYAIYYLHEFIGTSRESLSTALLHCDLNEIKTKLDKIIAQQREIIIQQAIIASQNKQLLQQHKLQLERLSSIESNTSHAEQYAEIAAVNAETCAWISLASYIDKRI